LKKSKPETETLESVSQDQRDCFRYDFQPGQGFEIEFKNETVEVVNISAGGIAFENICFKPFDVDSISFRLDIPNFTGPTDFTAGLRVLFIDAHNICHCLFEQCPLEQHELIHKYVLEMQKNDLAH
jgi:hypothetical protein